MTCSQAAVQVQKAVNEVYRLFNATQTPFVVADIIIPTDTCDINVRRSPRCAREANAVTYRSARTSELYSYTAKEI